jgi:hypothetical protein
MGALEGFNCRMLKILDPTPALMHAGNATGATDGYVCSGFLEVILNSSLKMKCAHVSGRRLA